VYSFFVQYARLDGFEPTRQKLADCRLSDLDRWVLAKLNKLVADVRARLDDFDAMPAARDVEAFVEELSTWYLRRGRRRYWKSEADADKTAAYATLHHVLVTLARLLAPFQPFLAEEMYQNLVRSVDASAPESVHHTDYPVVEPAFEDQRVLGQMERVLQLVNLGRAARNKAAIKVRQPVARLLVAGPADVGELESHVLDELNAKAIEQVADGTTLADYEVKPLISKLGPKYGARLRDIQAALASADAADVARRVGAGQSVQLAGLELLPEELEVRTRDRSGLAVAVEDDLVVAIDTNLTPELIREGQAREIVHRIQTMRKNADYKVEEKIVTYYQGGAQLEQVLADFGDYVKAETLSLDLRAGTPANPDFAEEFKLDGEAATLAVVRS
jgi:isoleucyl-tRNA synthetase